MDQKDGAIQRRSEGVQDEGGDAVRQLALAPAIHALEPSRDQQRGAAGLGGLRGQEGDEVVQPGSDQGAELDDLALFQAVGFGDLPAVFDVDHQPDLVDGNIRAFPPIDRDASERFQPVEGKPLGHFGLDHFPAR